VFTVFPRLRTSLTVAIAVACVSIPWLLSPMTPDSAFGQSSIQNDNSNLNNNTITYSYNIHQATNNTANIDQGNLQNRSVSYYNDTTGYLVYPASANSTQKQLPAVVMIHEWWGLNEHIKRQADTLAKEGYVVLAVDLYKGQVATDPNQAIALSSSVRNDSASAIANLESAVKYVKSLDMVNGSRVASLGWCFGGDWSLRLATNSTKENPLAATVLYYGRPITEQNALSNINWPVLGIFGDQDQSIPVESVKQFASALNASDITNEIYLYNGVGHAFANPSGDNYAPNESTDAWQKTLAFLREHV
jgi:carboxymethylenebutenolidase